MKNGSVIKAEALAIPWWLSVTGAFGALLTAADAVIALVHPSMLVSQHDQINGAVHIYAGYLAARNLAISALLLSLLIVGATRALGTLMVLVGLIQLLDACMDVAEGRWAVIPVVLALGLVFLIGSARRSGGYPFWRIEAWKMVQ